MQKFRRTAGHSLLLSLCFVIVSGCAAQVADSDEFVEVTSEALTCNLSGTWALRVDSSVRWPDNSSILAGAGHVVDWFLVNRTQSGGTLTDSVQACGSTVPDFKVSSPIIGSETYGLTYPNAMFDHVPAYVTSSTVRPTTTRVVGATFSQPSIAALLGLTMTNPLTDPWPKVASVMQADTDQDGFIGVTLLPKLGAPYANLPVFNGLTVQRVAKVYLARRLAFSLNGTISSCTKIIGNAVVSRQDRRVLGCGRTGGSSCTPTQAESIDGIPAWTVQGAAFSSVKLSAGATCASARAASF